MATSYKTPGVYVEEISKFPPSIAEVETAIPAFIGYTEKAEQNGQSLKNTPTKIKSMLEFDLYFGKGASFSITGVTASSASNGASDVSIKTTYYLYDSLQLYFANGGGDCYIVSVGAGFPSSPAVADFTGGITALEMYDEPTLILFPDATKFTTQASLATVQQAAIAQCANLMDRFAILDLRKDDAESGGQAFRNNIGMSNLKYAAAYTPWIKANIQRTFRLSDFEASFDLTKYTIALNVGGMTINDYIKKYKQLLTDIGVTKNNTDGTGKLKTNNSFTEDYLSKLYQANVAKPDDAITWIYGIATQIDALVKDTTKIKDADLQNFIKNNVVPIIDEKIASIIPLIKNAKPTPAPTVTIWTKIKDATAHATATPTEELCKGFLTDGTLTAIFNALNKMENCMAQAIDSYETALIENVPFYKNLLQALASKMNDLPPSGAVAGIYCATDNARGVWKAPANVSLSAVSGVSKQFTNSELDALNIHVDAGKSINAIRPITGQGIMVMGGRTLDGNSNEWRYVPVRRFFNYVEESCKKSTQWAVFEPNDANLWLSVKTMIENFLYNLWRRGALAGAKPEHAYYVHCGLSKTMTAQDILEGNLVVEIGMAAVRPAEFIVLKFSHKLQES